MTTIAHRTSNALGRIREAMLDIHDRLLDSPRPLRWVGGAAFRVGVRAGSASERVHRAYWRHIGVRSFELHFPADAEPYATEITTETTDG